MANLGPDYQFCDGCNTYWVDTGCGQPEEHANCPQSCSICGKPMTGRKGPDDCHSHSIDESRAFLARMRGQR